MNVHFLLLKVYLKIIEIRNGRLVPVVVTPVYPHGFAQGKPSIYKKVISFSNYYKGETTPCSTYLY